MAPTDRGRVLSTVIAKTRYQMSVLEHRQTTSGLRMWSFLDRADQARAVHPPLHLRRRLNPVRGVWSLPALRYRRARIQHLLCVRDNPYDSRENLRTLLARGNVMYRQLDIDRYERPILQCWNMDGDLSCQQVQAGHAVRRYRPLQCSSRRLSRRSIIKAASGGLAGSLLRGRGTPRSLGIEASSPL